MTNKEDETLFAKSALLNKAGHNSTAAIAASIINYYGNTPSVELQMSDCSRVVTLDFPILEEADRENTLFKLDTLLSVLTDFRSAVSEACDDAEKVQIKREKAKKKKAKKKTKKAKRRYEIN